MTTKKSKSTAKWLFLQNHSAKINFILIFDKHSCAGAGKWSQGVILHAFFNYDHHKKTKSTAKRLFLQNHSAKINFILFFDKHSCARPGKWPQGPIPPFCNYDHQKIKIDRQMAILAESFCKNQFYSFFRQTQLCKTRKMTPGGNFARFFQLWPPKNQNRPPNGYSCRIILQKSILFFFSTNTAVQDPENDPRG